MLTSDEAAGFGAHADSSVAHDGVHRRSSSPQRAVDVNGVPIRIPKLAVRNRRPLDDTKANERPAMYARSEGSRSGPPSSRSSQGTSTPISSRSASDDVLPTRRSLFNGSGQGSSDQSSKQKKKKGGMLGFLTLKEPSTAAWAEFANSEKEKARQKGAKPAAAGLPGLTSQKLPEYVPKVNSKWDGLPNSAKRRSIESSKAGGHRHRDSTFSTSTRTSNWTAITSNSAGSEEARRAFGSPHQSPRFPNRPSAQSNTPWSPDDWRVPTSGSSRPSFGQGIERQPIEESDENRPQTFLLPPSPEGHDKIVLAEPTEIMTPLTPPELEPDEVRYLQGFNARMSQESEKLAEMPATPPGNETGAEPMLVGIHYPELDAPDEHRPRTTSPAFCLPAILESKAPVIAPSTAPKSSRNTVNFSRPRSSAFPTPRSEQSPPLSIDEVTEMWHPPEGLPLSPTLTNEEGRIDPFLTDTFATHSRETGHIPQRVASTVDPSTRQTEQSSAEAEDSTSSDEDKSDENEGDLPHTGIAYPDEPDFSTDPMSTARPPATAPNADTSNTTPALRTAGSQASLTPSYAPSVMSEYWQLSPKERLGLGSKVRKSEALPWETSEGLKDDFEAAARPMSPFTESKRKRLSLRLGAKR